MNTVLTYAAVIGGACLIFALPALLMGEFEILERIDEAIWNFHHRKERRAARDSAP